MRIFNGLKFSDGEDRNNMADVIKKFDQHFLGQTQEFFERFQFNRRNQESGESIDEYVSVLRNMAKTCGFCDWWSGQPSWIVCFSSCKARSSFVCW